MHQLKCSAPHHYWWTKHRKTRCKLASNSIGIDPCGRVGIYNAIMFIWSIIGSCNSSWNGSRRRCLLMCTPRRHRNIPSTPETIRILHSWGNERIRIVSWLSAAAMVSVSLVQWEGAGGCCCAARVLVSVNWTVLSLEIELRGHKDTRRKLRSRRIDWCEVNILYFKSKGYQTWYKWVHAAGQHEIGVAKTIR